MWILRRQTTKLQAFGLVVIGSVFAKCFINGYEYITTTLVMMVVPLVYYARRDSWPIRKFLVWLGTSIMAACTAIFFSFAGLIFQISAVLGGPQAGIAHIVYSLGKRSYGDPSYFPANAAASLNAPTIPIIQRYLEGTFFGFGNYVRVLGVSSYQSPGQILYWHLIIAFLAFSLVALFFSTRAVSRRDSTLVPALVGATWFSILAPLSWFVIFKAHAFAHFHMDYIVWQMPFVFFGFATCGLAIRCLWLAITRLHPRVEPAGLIS